MLQNGWRIGRAFVLASAVAVILIATLEVTAIPDRSMAPVIAEEDLLLINKAAYLFTEPAAGDLVAVATHLHTQSGGGALFASRIAGVAGDTYTEADGSRETVRDGYVYLVGSADGGNLLDSRNAAIGQVAVSDLLGRIDGIVWPLARAGSLR